ncbi:hypothetical protein OE855_002603 [Salmonella enterica subsp. enterica serovar Schwarzengrund]|nr:hypothetical protein [Salmonella enterica subsp. enterica serovar Schwarzengrund]
MMDRFDWSKAPDWATCVVSMKGRPALSSPGYHWSEEPRACARMIRIQTGTEFTMNNPSSWEIVAKRPAGPTPDVTITRVNDDRLTESLRWSPSIIGTETITAPSNCRCTFTPVQQLSTAPDLLNQAAQLLAERGQQYDKSGNERSAAKIVAAFNTITGRDLTPGEGWLFLTLLKAVRFYSNTEILHRDSLEDMIAYAALHAEEYLNNER